MSRRDPSLRDFEKRLSGTATPLFLIDSQRVLRGFNAGCELLTGWMAAEVVGLVTHYASLVDVSGEQTLAASLCPPPDAFSGRVMHLPVRIAHRDGSTPETWVHYLPLHDAEGKQTAVLGAVGATPQTSPNDVSAASWHAELAALRARLKTRFGPQSLVCNGPAMRRTQAQLELAQGCRAAVLLSGESGSGREHLARVIHFGSAMKAQWFIPLDCKQLGADELTAVWHRLLERHTPAARAAFSPQPGTVFMADVEHLPRDVQGTLAQAFLQADAPPPLRLLSSTSIDMTQAVAVGSVRADFLSLISTLTIPVPPLRDRLDDLPLLTVHFLEELNRRGEKQVGGLAEELWPLLQRYHWPGNLDELAIVVREAHTVCESALIQPADLPFRFRNALDARELPPLVRPDLLPLDTMLTRVETRLIQIALERTRYNKSDAADLLGINRPRLYRRMEQLGIPDMPTRAEIPPTETPGAH